MQNVIMVLLHTLSDLDKLNYGEHSKYRLCSSKIYLTHVYMLFFKDNLFKTVPASYRLIKMLLDTLSDLVKLNHGE